MRELPPGLLALPAMREAHLHAPKAEWGAAIRRRRPRHRGRK